MENDWALQPTPDVMGNQARGSQDVAGEGTRRNWEAEQGKLQEETPK